MVGVNQRAKSFDKSTANNIRSQSTSYTITYQNLKKRTQDLNDRVRPMMASFSAALSSQNYNITGHVRHSTTPILQLLYWTSDKQGAVDQTKQIWRSWHFKILGKHGRCDFPGDVLFAPGLSLTPTRNIRIIVLTRRSARIAQQMFPRGMTLLRSRRRGVWRHHNKTVRPWQTKISDKNKHSDETNVYSCDERSRIHSCMGSVYNVHRAPTRPLPWAIYIAYLHKTSKNEVHAYR